MANWYVRSGAAGTGTGADWANAKTTLAAALTAGAAGDDFWVSEDHAETQASSMTLTIPGTAASPNRILCVNHAGSVPPVSADLRTTATISTTGANNLAIPSGHAYIYGITFTSGNLTNTAMLQIGATVSTAVGYVFDSCKLALGGNTAAGTIDIGQNMAAINPGSSRIILTNTTISFANVSQAARVFLTNFLWENTASAIAGTVPTTLFDTQAASRGNAYSFAIRGVDLSAVGAGKNLINVANAAGCTFLFEDCKLGASVSITTGSNLGPGGCTVIVCNSDSSGTNYRYERYTYQGTETTDTVRVRSGGATDGTTAVSRKIVSTANSKWYSPYESEWFYIWNDTTGGAKTITVYTLTDNVTLTTADCWLEIDYLGSTLTPIATIDTSTRTADVLAAGSNQPADTSTWVTTTIGTPVKQKLVATITPNMKGLFKVRFCLAKASTTVYVDPPTSASVV